MFFFSKNSLPTELFNNVIRRILFSCRVQFVFNNYFIPAILEKLTNAMRKLPKKNFIGIVYFYSLGTAASALMQALEILATGF